MKKILSLVLVTFFLTAVSGVFACDEMKKKDGKKTSKQTKIKSGKELKESKNGEGDESKYAKKTDKEVKS